MRDIDGVTQSLWHATAVAKPVTTSLPQDIESDVVIVGAGFTGLSAALELLQMGYRVVVLDAKEIAHGASGRSGGQVNLGLNESPSQLRERFGQAKSDALLTAIMETPDFLFELIKKYQLDCDAVQQGWIQSARYSQHSEVQKSLSREYAAFAESRNQPAPFRLLDKDEFEQLSGAVNCVGGLYCEKAGSIHPLSFTRELARVAIASGARIYTHTPMLGLRRLSSEHTDRDSAMQWQVDTPQGNIASKKVLICTNGYSERLPAEPDDSGQKSDTQRVSRLSSAIVPVRSVLAATEPLGDELQNSILPNRVTFVDKRKLILYLRYDRDGRLCVGDHGPMRDNFSLRDFQALKDKVLQCFPALADVSWDYHWGGRVAMTRSGLPFLSQISSGLYAGMGYNGRGVGMGVLMGRELARFADQGAGGPCLFPATDPEVFRLHRFHKSGVECTVQLYKLMDKLQALQLGKSQ